MKTVVIKTENDNQLNLILRLAIELNIEAEVSGEDTDEKNSIINLAEISFNKDWDSEEDEIWTEFLKNKNYVPTR